MVLANQLKTETKINICSKLNVRNEESTQAIYKQQLKSPRVTKVRAEMHPASTLKPYFSTALKNILHVQCINDRHNLYMVYSRPCDRQSRYCTEMVYLDCCRFAVNDVFILPHCNHNSVNAWKSCSIFLSRFLFLKFASYLPYVSIKSLSLRTKCPLTVPKTLQNFYLPSVVNPFDSAKKRVFVEGDF